MCIRDRMVALIAGVSFVGYVAIRILGAGRGLAVTALIGGPVSYTHLRAHETVLDLVCRLLLETKNKQITKQSRLCRQTTTTITIVSRGRSTRMR